MIRVLLRGYEVLTWLGIHLLQHVHRVVNARHHVIVNNLVGLCVILFLLTLSVSDVEELLGSFYKLARKGLRPGLQLERSVWGC
jgi:hypothetical protein